MMRKWALPHLHTDESLDSINSEDGRQIVQQVKHDMPTLLTARDWKSDWWNGKTFEYDARDYASKSDAYLPNLKSHKTKYLF